MLAVVPPSLCPCAAVVRKSASSFGRAAWLTVSEAAGCRTSVVWTVLAPAGAADITKAAATPKSVGAARSGSRFFACLAGAPKGLLPVQCALTEKTGQPAILLHVLLHGLPSA